MTDDDFEKALREANCWFTADVVKDPQMTRFKRDARWRQHQWARRVLEISEFGTHKRPKSDEQIPNGTRLLESDDKISNFLSDTIKDAVSERTKHKQKYQTLAVDRLKFDLLSSMPMVFNLFGEAATPGNEISRKKLAERFHVPYKSPSTIHFEWSPARRDDRYTNDGTAFDVALSFGDQPSTVIGIETKYHEHAIREPKAKPGEQARRDNQTNFLRQIAERSGVFQSGWEEPVLDTELRQLWRDHLLALSMRKQKESWSGDTRYVLVFPRRNVSFQRAADEYKKVLKPGDTSFQAVHLEDVVADAFAHGGDTEAKFRNRYLW